MNNNYKILAKGVCLLNMISTIWIFLDKIKYDYSDPSKRKIFGKIIGNIMLSCHPDLNSNCTPEQKQHLNNVQIILDILSKLDITKPVISSKPLALIPAQKLLTEEHETILRQNIKELIRYYNELINLFNKQIQIIKL